MKQFAILLSIFILGLYSCTTNQAESKSNDDYQITGVSFNQVTLNDQFWLPKIETNREITIPSSFKKCEETGRIDNFLKAAGKMEGKFETPFPFDDTDIYKILEGASYSLQVYPDPKLDSYMDSLIDIISDAQEPDGYLFTAHTIDPTNTHEWVGLQRWEKVSELSHELYNAGHLYEAAAAHYQATGKKNLLNIALKNADLLLKVFGEGKRNDAPGHEIVEMGLVKLYRITQKKEYLDLAEFFINCRGKERNPDKAYSQDHIPFIEQNEAIGHAVRAGYLYSGAADVAALKENKDYLNAIDSIWNNMVNKKLYITGGIGSVHWGERFGENYELPNLTSYNETCAAIANVYWNYRMFLLHGDSKYIDVMEKSLYNGVISGVGLNGSTFFYPNPLECDLQYHFNRGHMERQSWFDCSCCPTNMCRFLPSMPGYIYAQKDNGIYVNLFVQSEAEIEVKNKQVKIEQITSFPWKEEVEINVSPERKTSFTMFIRIPSWLGSQPLPSDLYKYLDQEYRLPEIKINGEKVEFILEKGYAAIHRSWSKNDKISFTLKQEVKLAKTDIKVKDNQNKLCIERGPFTYCVEETDNPNFSQISVNQKTKFTTVFEPQLLNGVNTILASYQNQTFKAIPYYSWCNRGQTRMKVWLPIQEN